MVRHTGGRRKKVTGKLHLKLHNRKEIGFLSPISSQQIYHVDFAKQMRSTPTHQQVKMLYIFYFSKLSSSYYYVSTDLFPPSSLSFSVIFL